MTHLLSDYPFQHLTNNGLTHPSTYTNLCFSPNCPNEPPSFPYTKEYTEMQRKIQEKGTALYVEHRQPHLNRDIMVFNSNMRPVYPNYLTYAAPNQTRY